MSASAQRTVLVTGGTTRLGLAVAERLRASGWRVLTSSHRADAGADLVADLSAPSGAAGLYAAAMRLLGGVPPDALVNNAALFTGDDAAVEAVNLEAPRKLTMMMAGRETGRGAVVNVLDASVLALRFDGSALSSGDVRQPTADGRSELFSGDVRQPTADDRAPLGDSCASPRYAASKRGLLEYTLKSAAMFAQTLRVNAVAPGPVLAPTGVRERAHETLLGRPRPEDVARAVEFLLDAESTTGAVIPVDGGQHLLEASILS